jgi:ABC-type multidrug transport system ATPase subunit
MRLEAALEPAVRQGLAQLEQALRVEHLSRSYGEVCAIRDLTFSVTQGSITAFLGRNGAGKSTAIACLTGLLAADAGNFTLFNQSLTLPSTRREIGVLPQNLGLFDDLTVEENILTQCRMFGTPTPEIAPRTTSLLEDLLLTNERRLRCGTLSAGTRKRAAFAVAVAHRPRFLFLDEPFENVDPIGVVAMKGWMQRFVREGHGTILLTTHMLDTVEKLCDHALIIEKGHLMWEGDPRSPYLQWSGGTAASLEDLFVAIAYETERGRKR